jgi:hypothetical protein
MATLEDENAQAIEIAAVEMSNLLVKHKVMGYFVLANEHGHSVFGADFAPAWSCIKEECAPDGMIAALKFEAIGDPPADEALEKLRRTAQALMIMAPRSQQIAHVLAYTRKFLEETTGEMVETVHTKVGRVQ